MYLFLLYLLHLRKTKIMARTEMPQKKKDILAAFNRAIDELRNKERPPTVNECIERAMTYPAPRYYVEYDACQRIISLMFRGIQPPMRNPMKIDMYDSIFKEFIRKGLSHDGYKYLHTIIQGQAPSFYVEKKTFFRIVEEQLKLERNNLKKK